MRSILLLSLLIHLYSYFLNTEGDNLSRTEGLFSDWPGAAVLKSTAKEGGDPSLKAHLVFNIFNVFLKNCN